MTCAQLPERGNLHSCEFAGNVKMVKNQTRRRKRALVLLWLLAVGHTLQLLEPIQSIDRVDSEREDAVTIAISIAPVVLLGVGVIVVAGLGLHSRLCCAFRRRTITIGNM